MEKRLTGTEDKTEEINAQVKKNKFKKVFTENIYEM